MTIKTRLGIEIDTLSARPWKGIVWHHSAGLDGQARDWDGIVKYHTSYRVDYETVSAEEFERRLRANQGTSFQKPWKAVGYHGGTEFVNSQPVFSWGRSLAMIGAHAGVKDASNQFNEEYLGFCAVGDFDKAPPNSALWDFNLRLTRSFMEAFRIPASHVIGHREVFDKLGIPRQKTCPGKCWDMALFRSEL